MVDTNALFLAVRSGFPLESEVDRLQPGAVMVVPTSVLAELDRLARLLTPGAAAARALAERYGRWSTDAPGDEGVLEAARAARASVVTADQELRRRLGAHGITTLIPRDRHRLQLVPGDAAPRDRARGDARASPRGNS